jgi:hypothetical protein
MKGKLLLIAHDASPMMEHVSLMMERASLLTFLFLEFARALIYAPQSLPSFNLWIATGKL